jgi:hypothetical protein
MTPPPFPIYLSHKFAKEALEYGMSHQAINPYNGTHSNNYEILRQDPKSLLPFGQLFTCHGVLIWKKNIFKRRTSPASTILISSTGKEFKKP